MIPLFLVVLLIILMMHGEISFSFDWLSVLFFSFLNTESLFSEEIKNKSM